MSPIWCQHGLNYLENVPIDLVHLTPSSGSSSVYWPGNQHENRCFHEIHQLSWYQSESFIWSRDIPVFSVTELARRRGQSREYMDSQLGLLMHLRKHSKIIKVFLAWHVSTSYSLIASSNSVWDCTMQGSPSSSTHLGGRPALLGLSNWFSNY